MWILIALSVLLLASVLLCVQLCRANRQLWEAYYDLWEEHENEKWLQCLKDSGAEIIEIKGL